MAQKYQDAEGEPQPSPMRDGKSRESDLPSEADSEKHKGDDGSDTPGSQNGNDPPGTRDVRARTLLFLRGLLWDRITHGGRY